MSKFPILLFNQMEQSFLYIAGYGLSDIVVKEMRFNTKQKIMYYLMIAVIGLCMLYYSNDH